MGMTLPTTTKLTVGTGLTLMGKFFLPQYGTGTNGTVWGPFLFSQDGGNGGNSYTKGDHSLK